MFMQIHIFTNSNKMEPKQITGLPTKCYQRASYFPRFIHFFRIMCVILCSLVSLNIP